MTHNIHTQNAGEHIGSGLAWLGFWLMLGMSSCTVTDTLNTFEEIKELRAENAQLKEQNK